MEVMESRRPREAWTRQRGARAGVFGEAARGREIVQVRASILPTSSPLQLWRRSPRRAAAVPFFWSQHYDVPINYVGHAEKWDELTIDGDVAARDCLLRYKRNGRALAIASIYRDVGSLEAEVAMEQDTA